MAPSRVLVIEDNEIDIGLLRHALDRQGEDYELKILSDGEQALQFVQEHRRGDREPEPCVILLDLYLPIHDGIAILRAIRQAPALEHIHVVVLSGSVSPLQAAEIASLGAVYRTKPTTLEKLVELAAEIIAICKSSPSAAKPLSPERD